MRIRSILLAALGATLVGGCASLTVMSHVPLSTIARLSKLTLAQIDPAELRVAARLTAELEPQPDGVKVVIEVRGSTSGTPAPLEMVLEAAGEPSELQPLAGERKAGFRLWVYRLSSHDVERLRRIIGESAGASAVSISAAVVACHRRPFGAAALPTTTYLRTDSSGFVVLSRDLDLRRVIDERDLAARIPACA